MNVEVINLLLSKGFHIVFIAFIFLIWHILENIEQYLNIYQNFKNRKINLLEQAINCPEIPDLELNRLKQLKVNEFYKQATGLEVGENIRSDVIKLMNELSINEKQINSIRHHFTKDQNNLQITKWEWSFSFISKWIFLILLTFTATIFVFAIMFIDIIKNDAELFKSILQLFLTSLFVGLMYVGEARKYYLIQKIYKTHQHVFKETEPNGKCKAESVALFLVVVMLVMNSEKIFRMIVAI